MSQEGESDHKFFTERSIIFHTKTSTLEANSLAGGIFNQMWDYFYVDQDLKKEKMVQNYSMSQQFKLLGAMQ